MVQSKKSRDMFKEKHQVICSKRNIKLYVQRETSSYMFKARCPEISMFKAKHSEIIVFKVKYPEIL